MSSTKAYNHNKIMNAVRRLLHISSRWEKPKKKWEAISIDQYAKLFALMHNEFLESKIKFPNTKNLIPKIVFSLKVNCNLEKEFYCRISF